MFRALVYTNLKLIHRLQIFILFLGYAIFYVKTMFSYNKCYVY